MQLYSILIRIQFSASSIKRYPIGILQFMNYMVDDNVNVTYFTQISYMKYGGFLTVMA